MTHKCLAALSIIAVYEKKTKTVAMNTWSACRRVRPWWRSHLRDIRSTNSESCRSRTLRNRNSD